MLPTREQDQRGTYREWILVEVAEVDAGDVVVEEAVATVAAEEGIGRENSTMALTSATYQGTSPMKNRRNWHPR